MRIWTKHLFSLPLFLSTCTATSINPALSFNNETLLARNETVILQAPLNTPTIVDTPRLRLSSYKEFADASPLPTTNISKTSSIGILRTLWIYLKKQKADRFPIKDV